MEQFTDKARLPLLKESCNENIFFWKEPIQATFSSLANIHEESLLGGHTDVAMVCALHSLRHSFMSGTALMSLNSQCIRVTAKLVCVDIEMKLHVLNSTYNFTLLTKYRYN